MASDDMTDEENALLVALYQGNEPRAEDPVAKALEARGLAQRADDGRSWVLTPSGCRHVSDLNPG
jgi:hypothetical protein